MISKNIVKQPKSIVEVTVTVPWSDLQTTWDQTLQKMAADIEIAGFRKGQAPLNMVEGQLGTRLQDEVLKNAMPNFLIEALKGTDIIPIDYPKYDLISFARGQQMQFKATITNRPQVTVGNYKTIKAVRPAIKTVADDEVTKVIDDLYKRWKVRQSSAVSSQLSAIKNQNSNAGSINYQGNGQAEIPNDEFAKAMGATTLNDLKTKIRADLEANEKNNNEIDYEEAI